MFKLWYGVYLLYQATLPTQEAMCLEINPKLIEQLRTHEGVRQFPYQDTVGKWTIGVGHNLSDKGLSFPIIDTLLREDIAEVQKELDDLYPAWCNLSENRQMVLVNMGFNLGVPRLSKFKKFLAALDDGNYQVAASEMLNSRWAEQVGNRAIELSKMMNEG